METEGRCLNAAEPWSRRCWVGYAITVVLEAALIAGLLAVRPYLPLADYPIPYMILIMAVAYQFGEGPAILAFLTSLVAYGYYFVPPYARFWPLANNVAGWTQLVAFFLGALIVGVVMVAIRRSQRRTRRLAEDLRESTERFRSLVETTGDWIWEVDAHGVYTYASPRVRDLLGYEPSEVLGKTPTDLMPPEEAARLAPLIQDHFQKAEPFRSLENLNLHRDGRKIMLETSGMPAFDECGTLVGYRGIDRDITETVALRQAIERQLVLLQRALVPPAPSTNSDYRTAAVYLPARRGESIGGDLYDVFATERGKVAVMIGDVAGKGIEAASLAAAARSTVRSFAYDLSSPGDALFHANAVLQSQADGLEGFVTALLAIIDPATGRLSYANAGHPPAAVWRTAGRVEFLEGGGPPIGLITGQQYAEFENHLDRGDKMILYTDGVLEAHRGRDLFGLEGIECALVEHGHGTPDEVASGLLAAARDWAEGCLRDDVAIVVVERCQ